MNKKGSHVEIIISFIIFVTFIFFLFSVVEPTIGTQKDKENIFDNLEYGIKNKISSNLTTITVVTSGGGSCISLANFISTFDIGENIVVKDISGRDLVSTINGDSLQIERGSASGNLLKIYYSEEFNELDTGTSCTQATYETSLTKVRRCVFQRKISDLVNQDYEDLKAELNVPEGVDFGYGIILSNGTIIETQEGELSTNVYVRETPIEYLDSRGNLMEGYLKIKIW